MSDDRCPEHNCDIAVCFEEHNMKGEEESMKHETECNNWREALGGQEFPTIEGAFDAGYQAAEAHLREPQTAETCQAVPPHPIGCLVLKEPDGPVGSIHVFAEDEESICLACEAEKQARNVARLAFETLAEERDHLRAERERHIEAAAHKELDWFAEKRRADLLEAKCAEMASVLRRTRHRLLVMVEADGEDALYADEIKAVDATLKDNPGQLLLDRLAKAEAKCAEMTRDLQSVFNGDGEAMRAILARTGKPLFGPATTAQLAFLSVGALLLLAASEGNPGQPLLERLAWLESQNRKQLDYSIALQRLVEHICHVGSIPEEIAKDCPHHAEMARKHLKWLEKLERVREHAAMSFKRPFYKPDMELGKALAACKEVKP
jgi:hypothetical protein